MKCGFSGGAASGCLPIAWALSLGKSGNRISAAQANKGSMIWARISSTSPKLSPRPSSKSAPNLCLFPPFPSLWFFSQAAAPAPLPCYYSFAFWISLLTPLFQPAPLCRFLALSHLSFTVLVLSPTSPPLSVPWTLGPSFIPHLSFHMFTFPH